MAPGGREGPAAQASHPPTTTQTPPGQPAPTLCSAAWLPVPYTFSPRALCDVSLAGRIQQLRPKTVVTLRQVTGSHLGQVTEPQGTEAGSERGGQAPESRSLAARG